MIEIVVYVIFLYACGCIARQLTRAVCFICSSAYIYGDAYFMIMKLYC